MIINNLKSRLISKLEIKSDHVVKPIYFEGLKKVGSPEAIALQYYEDGIDEIIYIDIVASLYQRSINFEQIKKTSQKVIVPITIGGGVKSLDDFKKLFANGADKVAINTYALQHNANIINEASNVFGSQSVVLNIEAKNRGGWWECYSDNGRIPSGKNVIDWVKEATERGAGEILIQSVDKDGSKKGFDKILINEIMKISTVPVIACSGAGSIEHITELYKKYQPSAIAMGSILHYKNISIKQLREKLNEIS